MLVQARAAAAAATHRDRLGAAVAALFAEKRANFDALCLHPAARGVPGEDLRAEFVALLNRNAAVTDLETVVQLVCAELGRSAPAEFASLFPFAAVLVDGPMVGRALAGPQRLPTCRT